MESGLFIISLDFELHWGSFDKHEITLRKNYYLNTREAIGEVLSLFEKNQIHATWATVGLLFNHNKTGLLNSLPERKPSYTNRRLSAYDYISKNNIGEDENEDPYHFGKSLIDAIRNTPGQEIGTHSFAHYYSNEPGQTQEEFYFDLKAAYDIARKTNIDLKSMVFPRNQFNKDYLDVCKQLGITAVRSNPLDWWWKIESTQNESIWKRVNRALDAYVSVGNKTSYKLSEIKRDNDPLLIPASRLLRPYRKRELILNSLKLHRIKNEILFAAKNNEVYHLWCHPHNFGRNTRRNLTDLSNLISYFSFLRNEFGMESKNMRELTELIQVTPIAE